MAIGLVIVLLVLSPAPLLPLAHAYRSLCAQYPTLALLTFHASPALLAFLSSLAGLMMLAGAWTGVTELIRTHRFNQHLRHGATTAPLHLVRAGETLGVADRLSYLEWSKPAACCFGFIRPRIALTAGLVTLLDEEELTAVLAHERQHLRRRDPLRYLLLHTFAASAFMFPVAADLRRRHESRIELDADRAALSIVSPGALAGALLAVLKSPQSSVLSVARLTATEARIAQLGGCAIMSPISQRLVIASFLLATVIALASANLTAPANTVEMVCKFCARAV